MIWISLLFAVASCNEDESLQNLKLSAGYFDESFTLPLDHINGDSGQIGIKVLLHIGDPAGPLFVYTGNEAPIEFFFYMTGWLVYTLGPMYNATVAFIEHRYYGESIPSPVNYAYLNSDQAILDFASIIMQLKPTETTPVVTFGGEYGGMLAAFMRIKFPHLIDGAISSSAPLLEYLDTQGIGVMHQTTQDFFNVIPNCAFNINDGFNILDVFAENEYTWPGLSAIFQTCQPITEMGQVYDLEDWIADAFETLAQVNYPYPTQVEGYLPANPVNVTCSIIAVYNQLPRNMWETVQGLAEAVFLLYNNTGASCFTPWAPVNDQNSMSWGYQKCSEFLMPYGQYGVPYDMFPSRPWSYQNFNASCYQTYGVYPNPQWYPINYGFTSYYVESLNNLSNVVFSYGNEDPWQSGSLKQAPNNNVAVIGINGGAHHIDLMRPNPNDPISVRFARRYENRLIQEWTGMSPS